VCLLSVLNKINCWFEPNEDILNQSADERQLGSGLFEIRRLCIPDINAWLLPGFMTTYSSTLRIETILSSETLMNLYPTAGVTTQKIVLFLVISDLCFCQMPFIWTWSSLIVQIWVMFLTHVQNRVKGAYIYVVCVKISELQNVLTFQIHTHSWI
jgi:hypothetical protein